MTVQIHPQEEIHGRRWTDEEIHQALSLHKEGLTWAQVAERLGRTRHGVMHALRDHGHRVNYLWTEEEEKKGQALRLGGMSYKEIAQILGRSRASVETRLRNLNHGRHYHNPNSRGKEIRETIHGWGPLLIWPCQTAYARQETE